MASGIDIETETLRTLEQAMAIPVAERTDWLRTQDIREEVLERVERMLTQERAAGAFLESPPVIGLSPSLGGRLPQPGDRLGAWELVRELDSGGMGMVFLARRADGTFEQQAAVKFIRTDLHFLEPRRRAHLTARLEEERRLLARLDHPNVARILDGGDVSGAPYLVMDYIDGQSLLDHCRERQLDARERIGLFVKVCAGVEAAHRHLIVHRDLKPQNILVGSDGEPRLLDFGIARTLGSDAASAGEALTTSLYAMTPGYASPEQVRMEPLTTASDVYSLGVILYEMLSGLRPYALEGKSPGEIERVVCETVPASMYRAAKAVRPAEPNEGVRLVELTGDLERIVAKALHKAPERRYLSARELAEDLQRYLAGMPVRAHPDDWRYRLMKFVRRHAVAAMAASLALAAILVASTLALWQARQASKAAEDMRTMNAYLIDVLNVSNPYETGSEITLSQALDEAANMIDERFAGRPDLAVEVRNTLGLSMLARYHLESAEAQIQRAIDDGELLFGSDDRRTVRALLMKGNIRRNQNRYQEAQQLFDDALARLQRAGDTDSGIYVDVLHDLGVLHLVREDYARAEAYLRRAVDADIRNAQTRTAGERGQSVASLAQAVAAKGRGDLTQAAQLYAQAQTLFEVAYPHGGPFAAVLLNNRAHLAKARGQMEEAIRLQVAAVEMHRRSFRGDHNLILVPMTNLARMLLDEGDVAMAAQWAGQAVAMAERLYTDHVHYYQINALAAQAEVFLAQSRRSDAENLLARIRTLVASIEEVPASTLALIEELKEQVVASD